MHRRLLAVPVLLLALLLGACGGSSTTAGSPASSSAPMGSPSSGMSPSSSTAPSSTCPTSNTRSFAKTRFVTDLGGSFYLMKRYVLDPYQAGKFTKGAKGRTTALIKAGVATATTAKLLKNATENAKANPTLCKTLATPLAELSSAVSDLAGSIKSGSFNPGSIAALGGLLNKAKSGAAQAGIPVPDQRVGLGG